MDKRREAEIAKDRPIRGGQIQGPYGTVDQERPIRPIDEMAPPDEPTPIDQGSVTAIPDGDVER